MRLRILLLVVSSLVMGGCERGAPPAPAPAAPRAAEAPSSRLPAPRTTDGAIAVHNLLADIEQHEARLAAEPHDAARMRALVGLHMARAQFLGQLASYERALHWAEQLVRAAPEDAQSYLTRAAIHGRLHAFEAARADLAEAERRGLRGPEVEGPRAALLLATGQPAEALRLYRAAAEARPTLESLAALAGALASEGQLEEAGRLYVRARAAYRDVSPFPVAWLEFQEGLLAERAGDLKGAGKAWAAAHARLPQYAAAAAHLAEVETAEGRTREAIALLQPLTQNTDDPEYAAQLAPLLRASGQQAEAQRLLGRAKEGFEHWGTRFPVAFADHAARFWLGEGGDARRALALAELNLSARRTAEAFALYQEAAKAAGEAHPGCAQARRLLPQEGLSPVLVTRVREAIAACPPQQEARGTAARGK
jgi:tetratricopeptide (TPR) repeat protein